MDNSTLNSRIQQTAEILSTKGFTLNSVVLKLQQVLDAIGIEDSEIGVKILEAETTVYEDFEKAFFSGDGLGIEKGKLLVMPIAADSNFPKAKLKVVWEILKGNDPFKKKDVQLTGSGTNLAEILKPVENFSDIELLQKYGKECAPNIEEELERRTHKRPCIVFEEDTGKIDIENSLYMVRKARRQDTPKSFMIRGELKILYPVGDFPANVFFECPIHPNILLVDGYCEECSQVWDTTEYDKNAFLRLISENEDIDIRIYKEKTFAELKKDFPKVYLKFNELKEESKLPSLKKRIGKYKDGDPFRVVHTTH